MTDPAIATAADYADALYTARRSKSIIELFILLVLIYQLGLFFLARYTDVLIPATVGTTQPASTQPVMRPGMYLLEYLQTTSMFVGCILGVVLSFVLLLIVNIMLVGRLIGVARTTSAYVWCVLLMFLLFPWQFFFPDFNNLRLPSVLYTLNELLTGAKFQTQNLNEALLKWARFVGWPVVATILLLNIRIKSNRGLRQAFGEVEPEAPAA